MKRSERFVSELMHQYANNDLKIRRNAVKELTLRIEEFFDSVMHDISKYTEKQNRKTIMVDDVVMVLSRKYHI